MLTAMKLAWLVAAAVTVMLIVVLVLVAMDHSRYETKTADGLTVRIDKKTGTTDVLGRDERGVAWRRVQEATPTPATLKANGPDPEKCAQVRAQYPNPSDWGRQAVLAALNCN